MLGLLLIPLIILVFVIGLSFLKRRKLESISHDLPQLDADLEMRVQEAIDKKLADIKSEVLRKQFDRYQPRRLVWSGTVFRAGVGTFRAGVGRGRVGRLGGFLENRDFEI